MAFDASDLPVPPGFSTAVPPVIRMGRSECHLRVGYGPNMSLGMVPVVQIQMGHLSQICTITLKGVRAEVASELKGVMNYAANGNLRIVTQDEAGETVKTNLVIKIPSTPAEKEVAFGPEQTSYWSEPGEINYPCKTLQFQVKEISTQTTPARRGLTTDITNIPSRRQEAQERQEQANREIANYHAAAQSAQRERELRYPNITQALTRAAQNTAQIIDDFNALGNPTAPSEPKPVKPMEPKPINTKRRFAIKRPDQETE